MLKKILFLSILFLCKSYCLGQDWNHNLLKGNYIFSQSSSTYWDTNHITGEITSINIPYLVNYKSILISLRDKNLVQLDSSSNNINVSYIGIYNIVQGTLVISLEKKILYHPLARLAINDSLKNDTIILDQKYKTAYLIDYKEDFSDFALIHISKTKQTNYYKFIEEEENIYSY